MPIAPNSSDSDDVHAIALTEEMRLWPTDAPSVV